MSRAKSITFAILAAAFYAINVPFSKLLLIRNHAHPHRHTFTHTHDGSTHMHTVVHEHDHKHYREEGGHWPHHSVKELEQELKAHNYHAKKDAET